MNTTTHEATTQPTGKTATNPARIRTAIAAWLDKHDEAITAGMVVAFLILDLLGRL